MATQDQDYDSDFDTPSTYTGSKIGRAKDAIKEGLSDVQKRFESSSMNIGWKKTLPMAIIGALGVLLYSRRSRSKSTARTLKNKVKGKTRRAIHKGSSSIKNNSHRVQA